VCGAELEVTRTPVAWSYEAVVVTVVKENDRRFRFADMKPAATQENTMANTVECPSCQHIWPASEAVLGLQSCPSCGAALEVYVAC